MTEQSDTLLRNALDAVDRGRRWAILGVAALFIATVVAFASMSAAAAAARLAQGEPAAMLKPLFAATVIQMLFAGCCTVVVMMHVTRTTKAVLRSIEAVRRGA